MTSLKIWAVGILVVLVSLSACNSRKYHTGIMKKHGTPSGKKPSYLHH